MEIKVVTTDKGRVFIDETAKIKESSYYENDGVVFLSDAFYNEGNNPNNSNPRVSDFNNKIVATIDFSLDKDLPMVVIGDDINRLAFEYYISDELIKVSDAFHWSKGYKAKQKGVYTEEDLASAMLNYHEEISLKKNAGKSAAQIRKEVVQSLSKEREECMELVMEDYEVGEGWAGDDYNGEPITEYRTRLKTDRRSDGQLIAYIKSK